MSNNTCLNNQKPSLLAQIIDYEENLLEQDEVVELFQELINSGLAWQLQGHYGRTAKHLIENGYCHPAC